MKDFLSHFGRRNKWRNPSRPSDRSGRCLNLNLSKRKKSVGLQDTVRTADTTLLTVYSKKCRGNMNNGNQELKVYLYKEYEESGKN